MSYRALRSVVCAAFLVCFLRAASAQGVPPAPPAPTPQSPANGAQVTQPVTLSWSGVTDRTGIDGYIWDVSASPTFAPRAAWGSTNHDDLNDSFSGLSNGTYYWRVRSFNGAFDQSLNSAARSFTIVGTAPETPATPAILYPPSGLSIHPYEGLDVRYSPVADVAIYELEIDDEPSFDPDNGGYITGRTVGPAFGFAVADPGTWYIRVRAIGNNGLRSVPSATVQFTVSYSAPIPPARTLLAPASGATVTFPFTFDWTDVPNNQTDGYELQIDYSSGFSQVDLFVTDIFASNFTLNDYISAGTKFWRVRSYHGNASETVGAVSAWSAVRSFVLSNAPPVLVGLDQVETTAFSGNNAWGYVQLSGPAPAAGVVVNLSSSDPAVLSTPASVTVPAGSARMFAPFAARDVSANTTVRVNATYAGNTFFADYTIRAATPERIDIYGLDTAAPFAQLLMRGRAPAGGATIALSSSNPALVGTPASMTVPAGSSFANVMLVPGTAPFGKAIVTASYNGRGVQIPAFKRNSVPPSALVLEPRSVVGGPGALPDAVISLAGLFNDAPFGSAPVTLSSSNTAAAVITSSMWVDRLSCAPVITKVVSVPTPVTISATAGGVTVSGVLTVLPASGGGGGSGPQTFTGRVDRNSTKTHSVAIGAAGVVSASLTWSGSAPLSLTARNSSGTTVATGTGPSPIQISFTAPAPGTYSFQVRNNSGSVRADYTLRVTPPAGGGSGSDTTAPSVAVSVPPAGSIIGGTATVGASVSENGDIARVDFFADGSLIGTAVMPPFSVLWDTRAAAGGQHTLTARATDGAGNSTLSGPVSVSVNNSTPDTTPPSAQMSWPLPGEVVVRQLVINIEAVAFDDLDVAKVEFYADGRLILADTTAPFSVGWYTAYESDGAHQLTARAIDAAGNWADSAPITVMVQN